MRKHARLFFVLTAAGIAVVGTAAPTEALGPLHQVYGTVNYPGGYPPLGWPELQFHACIIGKPDTLWSGGSGATTVWYDGQYCWARVQCAQFDPPWEDGDLLHMFLWGDGANNPPWFLPGACSVWIVLDASEPEQVWGFPWPPVLGPWIFWNLRAELQGGEVRLSWWPIPGEAISVSVYRDTCACFYPDVVDHTNLVAAVAGSVGVYFDPYGVGNPNVNAFYRLKAYDYISWSTPGDVSEAVGEFDYSTATSDR